MSSPSPSSSGQSYHPGHASAQSPHAGHASSQSPHAGHASAQSPVGHTSSQSPHVGHASAQSPVGKSSTAPLSADKKEEGESSDARSMPSQPDTTSPPKYLNPLETFHSALGIPTPKPKKTKRSLLGRKKPAPDPEQQPQLSKTNQGVYQSVISYERWARIRYRLCDFVVTVSMFLQIIVGASVTAFGAGSANHIIITVFGAANTALASLLAVLKSQGLPTRLRMDWIGWRDLREYIEEREREIEMTITGKLPEAGENRKEINIRAEIETIEDKYKLMKNTVEANRPDTYTKLS